MLYQPMIKTKTKTYCDKVYTNVRGVRKNVSEKDIESESLNNGMIHYLG